MSDLDYNNVDWQTPHSIIKFYKQNYIYFNNLESLRTQDEILNVINVKGKYIDSLIKIDHLSKALNITLENENLILKIEDTELQKLHKTQNDYYFGVINGYLKNYKTAVKVFSQLSKDDSENDSYRDWLKQMRTNLLTENLKYLSYLGGLIIFLDIILGLAFDIELNKYLVVLGFISLFGNWIIPLLLKQKDKK